MKKKTDPRHKARVKLMKMLFQVEFHKNFQYPNDSPIINILNNKKKIDSFISKNAPAWPINQIASVDLATLRLAIWELKFKEDKAPYKAIIDEAVEIAKEYGSKSSPSFVNGVLGAIVKKES